MIGDEFGRKKVMLVGVGLFCAGSVLAHRGSDPGECR
jgi:MFS family permease